MNDGANHLGLGDDFDAGAIDATKEFWPAGQGVGAINALIPAGDLVMQIVEEAEAVLTRTAALRR